MYLQCVQQCAHAAQRANYILGCIRRGVSSREMEVIVHLCCAVVRPHLGVLSPGWGPPAQDMEMLEQVQRQSEGWSASPKKTDGET